MKIRMVFDLWDKKNKQIVNVTEMVEAERATQSGILQATQKKVYEYMKLGFEVLGIQRTSKNGKGDFLG